MASAAKVLAFLLVVSASAEDSCRAADGCVDEISLLQTGKAKIASTAKTQDELKEFIERLFGSVSQAGSQLLDQFGGVAAEVLKDKDIQAGLANVVQTMGGVKELASKVTSMDSEQVGYAIGKEYSTNLGKVFDGIETALNDGSVQRGIGAVQDSFDGWLQDVDKDFQAKKEQDSTPEMKAVHEQGIEQAKSLKAAMHGLVSMLQDATKPSDEDEIDREIRKLTEASQAAKEDSSLIKSATQ
eukprot:gnl/TRDRNA2_/TRDRNA2_180944_c0_seq1.p1 gnl/TRDRNA2_/TRDRNA2_180944_c0~~gnl/TRDRNA2_/TRDRNA2_180944_c0_seq1.p1  ORF type:complete len:264 (-),score=72.94 gnl/TRDRNA2_/TRDRNA2_180944_c0_seq1:74-799(-)